MFYVDTVKVLLWLFLLKAVCLAINNEGLNRDFKRMPLADSKSLITESTEESPNQYSHHYETNEQQQPEDGEKYVDPQRRHLNDEYRAEKSVKYVQEDKEPQSYKFGYEIKDEHEGHQYRHEQKDEQGSIQGRFGYRDAKGQYRQVDYVADDYGFRAKVKTNEAGIANQNPANVVIQKEGENEGGDEIQIEHSQNTDNRHTENTNVRYNTKKSSTSAHYHRKPVVENESHADDSPYETKNGHPHRHYADYYVHSDHPKSVAESEGYHHSKNDETGSSEEDPSTTVHQFYRKEHNPHSGYQPSSEQYHEVPDTETHKYTQNVHHEVPDTETHKYTQNVHHEVPDIETHKYAQKVYHEMPDTETHKYTQKVSPHHYQENSEVRSPSTYQYELDIDGHSYRYVRRPSPSVYAHPHDDQSNSKHDKEHHTHRPEHTETDGHEAKLKEDAETYTLSDYKYKKSNVEQKYQPPKQRLLLPQTVEHDYTTHSHQDVHSQNQEDNARSYPNEEVGIVKYEYNDDSLDHNKPKNSEAETVHQVTPVVHQYVQVINEPQTSAPQSYSREHVSYGHRQLPYEVTQVRPESVVLLEPQSKFQDVYHGERTHDQKSPQSSNLQSLKYKAKNNGQQPLQEAVLELNPEVYKQLIENKSPGHRLVAIPVNHLTEGNAKAPGQSNGHPRARPPHGILHIPLNGDSRPSFDLKSAPLVLHIGNEQSENSKRVEAKYQPHKLISKKHRTYLHNLQSPAVQILKNGRRYINKEYTKENWIPMTPAWNQIRRKSPHARNYPSSRTHETPVPEISQVSNGETFKFLQAESSNHPVDLNRQQGKIVKNGNIQSKKIIPGIYIVSSSSTKTSQLKDSKGHTLFVTRS